MRLDFDSLSDGMTNIGITLHADMDIHGQTAERCEIILIEYDTNYFHLSPPCVMWSHKKTTPFLYDFYE